MTTGHLDEVMAIDAQCYPKPWPRAVYESELARPHDRLYLIARAESPQPNPPQPSPIVGHAGVAFEDSEAHITTVTVAPHCQGRGIGARLFLALALAARRRNTSLALEVAADNPSAQSLYRRFGLAPVGIQRGYYTGINYTGINSTAGTSASPDAVVMRADNIHHPDYADRLIKIAVELDCT